MTATAVAMMVTTAAVAAAVAAKTTVSAMIVGAQTTINSKWQQKKRRWGRAEATETAIGTEMVTATATKMAPTPTTGINNIKSDNASRKCLAANDCTDALAFPLPPPLPLLPCGNVGSKWDNDNGDGGSGNIDNEDNCWRDGGHDCSWC